MLEQARSGRRRMPSGVITLLFSDIEGSTSLLYELGDLFSAMISRHHELLRSIFARHDGVEVSNAGDGFFFVFALASQAVAAAVEAQRALHSEPWPKGIQLRVRMGLHTGEPKVTEDENYAGLDVHRAARISAAANGGQVLLSADTREHLVQEGYPSLVLRDTGSHRLKDLIYPEHLFELAIPGVPEVLAPIRSLSNRPNNLPAQPTAFVGRTREVSEICRLLLRDDTRMVTLTGPGGTGKTRLSLEVARSLLDSFPAGVFQVPLAPVTNPAIVPQTIAQSLGIPELPTRPVIETLKTILSSRKMLIVLDNLEQVLGCAPMVAELLSGCPLLKVLVTSRETLKIRFEREYPVPALQLPAAGVAQQDPAVLAECESVRLFVDRVRDFKPDFELSRETAPVVAAICTRLEGMPLAIELTAPRMGLLTPQALLNRLNDRLGFLKGGAKDLAQRHQTLRAAIDWSYNLLEEPDRALFRQAAVFVGGFSVESAEAVCGMDTAVPDLLGGLASLADKSLLKRGEVEGELRLSMMETIREYALEQLRVTPGYSAVRALHAMHFVRLAEELAPGLMGKDQRRFVGRMLTEADNIRAALTWALEQPTAEVTSRLMHALLWLWIPKGMFAEGKAWVARALEQTRRTGSRSLERAMVLEVAGWLGVLSGDYASALAFCEEGVAIFKEVGKEAEGARAQIVLGVTSAMAGREEGPMTLNDALAVCAEHQDRYGTALGLIAMGELQRGIGNGEQARSCYEDAMVILRELGNIYWPCLLNQNLAHLRLHEGDWKGAAELLAPTVELGQEFNYALVFNLYLVGMGGVAVVRGRAAEGVRLFGAVDALLRSMGATLEPQDQAEFDRHVSTAKEVLGEDAFQAAWLEGARWTREECIAATISLRS
jgi:predicted ATPase/class 3 adenylate cyclase